MIKDNFGKHLLSDYARANGEIANSTVFQGTLYELTVMRELVNKLRFNSVHLVGGSYDRGIDIKGKWDISHIIEEVDKQVSFHTDLPKRFKLKDSSFKPWRDRVKKGKYMDCYVQCKAFNSDKVTGRQVRELIGTFSMKVPPTKRNSSVMVMSSPTMFTKDGLTLFNEANIPMIFARVEMLKKLANGDYDFEKSGQLVQYYENEYASKLLANCGIKEWLKLKCYDNEALID